MTSVTSSSPPLVRAAIADGVATITLARGEAGNAMNAEFIEAFASGVAEVAGTEGVRAILIEGEGKNFCVGGDLRAFASLAEPAKYLGALADRLHEGVLMLSRHPAPVIVAAQGAAAGAGLSLVAGADIVLAGASATFTIAYTAIGLTADGGATWLLPRLIGLRRTQEMAYTGRRLTAEEAERFGLVTRVVDDAALADEARTLAAAIARGPSAAFGAVKQLLQDAGGATLEAQLAAEAGAITRAMAGADAREGVAAFLERRSASFTGR